MTRRALLGSTAAIPIMGAKPMPEQPRVVASVLAIPHEHQAYDTAGNWSFHPHPSRTLLVSVSQLPDWRYEALVAVHELVEALLCRHRGIGEDRVTWFDLAFEEKRQVALANARSMPGDNAAAIEKLEAMEPGDDTMAPYFREHQFATKVEEMLAAELGVSWADYTKAIEAL